MDIIIPFNYGNHEVRVTTDKRGNSWWVASDVCKILELDTSIMVNGRPDRPGSGLDDDEKDTAIVSTLGGPQEMLTVNEPGLYTLIFKSRKPEAKAFKRWVTHEILPQIRKTGKYEMPGVGLMDEDAKKSNMMHYSVAGLCQEADKYLGGKAALTALNYFTGMPIDDLMEELEAQKETKEGAHTDDSSIPTSVIEFVASRCALKKDGYISKMDIYSAYESHCQGNNIYNEGYDIFFRALYCLGPIKQIRKRVGQKRVHGITGIRLKTPCELKAAATMEIIA